MASGDTPDEDPFAQPYMDEEPQAAVIADVATAPDPDGDGNPNPVVLEEAVGRINEIYAVVPLINAAPLAMSSTIPAASAAVSRSRGTPTQA